MNAASKPEQTALSLPQRAAVALNTAEHELRLRELLTNSAGILTVTNKAGREECHSAYMVLKNTRCNIKNLADDATEDAKAFTKAVKEEAARLISITEKEEDRLQALRDEWDAKIEAEKQVKIAAERARTDAIKADIDAIRNLAVKAAGMTSSVIEDCLCSIEGIDATESRFAEFAEEAGKVIAETTDKLAAMFAAAVAAEKAEADRLAAIEAENKRIAAEREELAKLRAEAAERERIAAAERAEADRKAAAERAEADRKAQVELAAQRAELAKQAAAQEAAAANQREEMRKEQAERERVAAEAKRQMEAQQAAIAAERAEIARQQQAMADAAKLDADHAEALPMNVQFDAELEEERVRQRDLADQAAADARERADDERAAGLPAGALGADALAGIEITEGPDDSEIIDLVMANWYPLDRAAAVERLAAIDFAAARGRLEA